MTGLEEGERPNGNSSCALSRVARALKFCMGTNSDPLFLLVKLDFFGNVLIPFNYGNSRSTVRCSHGVERSASPAREKQQSTQEMRRRATRLGTTAPTTAPSRAYAYGRLRIRVMRGRPRG